MPFAPLEPPLRKDSSWEEDVPFYMPLKDLVNLREKTSTKTSVSISSEKLYKSLAKPLLKMLVMKELLLSEDFWNNKTKEWDSMLRSENTLI